MPCDERHYPFPRTVQIKLVASPNGDYDIAPGKVKKATVSILDND